uniref:Lipocalin n=1 Tax=Rhipicephalus zambeziensis TaxID=60191 RepID=A0A224YNI4_9ACAR
MALYTLWLFLLTVIVVSPHLVTEGKADGAEASARRRRIIPLKFVTSGIRYLYLATLDYTGAECVKATTTNASFIKRTFSEKVELMFSTGDSEHKNVDYTPIWKSKNPLRVQGFRSSESSGSTNNITKVYYALEYCAIVQTRSETEEGDSEDWELWVNDNFGKEAEDDTFCRQYYSFLCNCTNSNKYEFKDCKQYAGKAILL